MFYLFSCIVPHKHTFFYKNDLLLRSYFRQSVLLSKCPGKPSRLQVSVGLSVTMYGGTDYNNPCYCRSLSSDIHIPKNRISPTSEFFKKLLYPHTLFYNAKPFKNLYAIHKSLIICPLFLLVMGVIHRIHIILQKLPVL